ncbi:hypothetical protein KG112_01550 [Nocardioides sp. zg-ZUI104]|uniref:hypothetical protein n=1 Tax=Nocardioides faecalis TaxID=2803858 RepID=UPI001BD16A90|nr:hypothetical protein [Nocardioides faecalis]MBS4751490.1 hypothetical protein [Nocardioides faecalis]
MRALGLVLAVLALVLAVTALPHGPDGPEDGRDRTVTETDRDPSPTPATSEPAATEPAATQSAGAASGDGPRWRTERVLPPDGMLVAYYGAPRTPALGVLGETSPERAFRRLRRAAAPFESPGHPVREVFELIVTIADAHPGKDGDYSHDVRKRDVRRYVDAARRLGVLLVLDLQPGRSDFLKVAKRWRWALLQPHVGLALDPEWRMGRHQVPGRTIGRVGAREVNRTSRWLSRLVVRHDLPEKAFVLHQFRSSMLPGISRIVSRPGLRMIQHVDGFGNRRQKLATYRAVARPKQFAMGFKLFYDEDVNRMGAAAVRKIRPRVRFVSYQ